MKVSLIIMAAGLGSRYGGDKQVDGVGPHNEILMEYSIHDALRAGFHKIVFIIKPDMEEMMERLCGGYLRQKTAKDGSPVEVAYAFQDFSSVPDFYQIPAERTKPFGTVHALLCAADVVSEPFCVINADDYYGKDAYRRMSAFLDSLGENARGRYAMAGFPLENTLSEFGGVTRGLCVTDGAGDLTSIVETKNILKDEQGPYVKEGEGVKRLDGSPPVSMNMWAFTPDVLELLEERFIQFLSDGGLVEPNSEFLIPTEIGAVLSDGVKVKVLPTPGKWFGMTFSEETPMVRQALAQMTQAGIYPTPLF